MSAAAQLDIAGAKGGESKPHTPYKAPDTALSIATAKMLYIISEGEIAGPVNDGRSWKLDGTPLIGPDGSEAFPGTTWEFRSGSVDQEHIAGFPAAEYEQSTGLPVELRSDAPWTRAITNRDLSAVRVRLSWPQIFEIQSNGDQVGYRIDYAIELSVNGGAFSTVLNATLADKGTTEYERSHRIDLPSDFTSAVLRVRRLTPNRNDPASFADTMRVKALTEVVDAKLRYPNLALAALQYDAAQFSNIPKFSLLCRGRIIKVPSNYDPSTRLYTGSWDGTFKLAYSNNPAWCWYDLLLHRRYGLGRRITADMVDRWTLYEIGRYCDVMVPDGRGGVQPRMTTNVYIQDQAEGYALLADLASVFRGSSCWNGSQVTVIADIPGNDDGYVFTRSNIVGEFDYGAIALPDRHTRAKVSWDNPENEFKTEPVPVTNEDMIGVLGHRMLDVARFACTVEGEAIRHGIWALKSEELETWAVRFTTGMEGRNIEPGQIISVADEMLSGRPNGGRISGATTRVITLDIDAQVQPEDRLIINLPSGKAEGRIVKSIAGRAVTVMADYSELPQAECSWSVESADLAVMRFRVQTIEPKGMHQWEISAVQHEPAKFDAIDHGARVDPQPITILPPGVIDPPESVSISSRSVVSQGIAITTMRATWPAVKGAISYSVEWRKDSGSWIRLPSTGTLGVEVEGIYSGIYQVRVAAVSVLDVSSVFTTSALTVLKGKEGLPPAVAYLTASSELFAIGLKWGFPPGAEDTQRTEIWYSPSNSLESATKLTDLAYPQSDYKLQGLAAGVSFFFWARLVDRTGNIGLWYPDVNGVLGQSGSDASPVLELIAGQIGESELGQELLKEIEKISGDGPDSVNERLDQAKQDLAALIDEIAGEWRPDEPYLRGVILRLGQRLYQAKVDVPAGVSPPNDDYWADVGTSLETANALAQQVQSNTTSITELDGVVTAQAATLQSLRAAYRDDDDSAGLAGLVSDWNAEAGIAEQRKVFATEQRATAERFFSMDARVDGNTAGLSTLETVVATDRQATATRLDQLKAGVDANTSSIQNVQEAQSDATQSLAALSTTVSAVYSSVRDDDDSAGLAAIVESWQSAARFAAETRALADADQALVRRSEQLEVSLKDTNAAVQTVSQAQVGTDGKLSTMWAVKMQLNSQGQYVATGIGLGIENGPAGLQSQFLVQADRFAVVNGVNSTPAVPFVVQSGQVFMDSAFIMDGTITNAKIGSFISSTNFVAGESGWRLNKDGTFEINGSVPGQGRSMQTHRSLRYWDGSNRKRLQLGDQTE